MTAGMTMWNALITASIMGGILACVLAVATLIYMLERERRDRSILPWGPRKKVEKARAAAEVTELQTRQEAADIMRLSLEPQRARVLKAIENGELASPEDLPALGAGSKNGDRLRESLYS